MHVSRWLVVSLVAGALFGAPAWALDVDSVFIGAVEDREQDANLVYVLVVSVFAEDIAGGRVFRPGNPTPICELDLEDGTCNILGTSLADFCSRFGFGDFLIEIDAAAGSDDTVTVFFDPGCVDPIDGDPDITSPTPGQNIAPNPGPADFCMDCVNCGQENYQFELTELDAGDFQRASFAPRCWDPGVCLPTLAGQEFRVSAIELFSDFEPAVTDGGDDFTYVSFFQTANLEVFDVVDPAPTTPPAVPAGTGLSEPASVAKLTADGSSLDLTWDVDSCCAVSAHHLIHGLSADLPAAAQGTFNVAGSQCSTGSFGNFNWTGVPQPAQGDFVWWILLANDGGTAEGSWGEDSAGFERSGPGPGGISNTCGLSARSLANTCGR
ncbi:hypothetical protein ABI59_09280 [Acidobacteria bacterium Mor1]|nr:hypothetical protein ABI59_09280 [Acidobacteria bacterium Mor1]